MKTAVQGRPAHLYDTLSSFSNYDDGGTILFGVDEQNDFAQTGVDDAQDLFSKIRTGKGCTPKKPTILALAVALELTLDETDALLEREYQVGGSTSLLDAIRRDMKKRGTMR